jgi:two-component system, cell cycle response regulator
MKKEVVVFETDPNVLKFLKSFFKGRDEYAVSFMKRDSDALRKKLAKTEPDVLIVSSPEGLKHIKTDEVKCPIVAIVTLDKTNGIRTVIDSAVECYLLSPFHKDELDNKLRLATRQRSWLDILNREKQDLQAIVELTDLVSSTLKPKQVLDIIVRKISETINLKRCSFFSIGIGKQKYAEVMSSSDSIGKQKIKVDLKKYPEIRKALSSRKTILVKNVQRDPLMTEVKGLIAPLNIRSIIAVPVIFRDEVIGTLVLSTTKEGQSFKKREVRLFMALANASANALYNAFLYEHLDREKTRLEKLAITDYLTGIYNVRYFYNRLEEEFSRAERYQLPLSCIMFDIDYYKKINDTFGHRIGDIVLREFAQLVRSHARKSDIFARYGGEEFIMLLPQTAREGAITEAERIRKAVVEHSFHTKETNIRITVSVGVVSLPDEKIKNYDELIHCADTALFEAKNKGRNSVIVYSSK